MISDDLVEVEVKSFNFSERVCSFFFFVITKMIRQYTLFENNSNLIWCFGRFLLSL